MNLKLRILSFTFKIHFNITLEKNYEWELNWNR